MGRTGRAPFPICLPRGKGKKKHRIPYGSESGVLPQAV